MTELGICIMIIFILGLSTAVTFSAALIQYNRLEQVKRDLLRAEEARDDWKEMANELADSLREREEDSENFGVITITEAQMEEICRQYLKGREWEE